MILADENINKSIIDEIRNVGIPVYAVVELMQGTEDIDIIEFSRDPPRIILTEDKDFGEWVFAHHIKHISVIFLRYNFKDTDKIIRILINLLENRSSDLHNKFTTITINKIRIRTLP